MGEAKAFSFQPAAGLEGNRHDEQQPAKGWQAGGYMGAKPIGPRTDLSHGGWSKDDAASQPHDLHR